jgi:hypothetical protein
VSAVLAGVVKRYLINPTGIAYGVGRTVGPYSHSTAYALRSREGEPAGSCRSPSDDLAALFPVAEASCGPAPSAPAPALAHRARSAGTGRIPSVGEAVVASVTFDRNVSSPRAFGTVVSDLGYPL